MVKLPNDERLVLVALGKDVYNQRSTSSGSEDVGVNKSEFFQFLCNAGSLIKTKKEIEPLPQTLIFKSRYLCNLMS